MINRIINDEKMFNLTKIESPSALNCNESITLESDFVLNDIRVKILPR
jgi:DNA-binding cell septation regulator SpoVG